MSGMMDFLMVGAAYGALALGAAAVLWLYLRLLRDLPATGEGALALQSSAALSGVVFLTSTADFGTGPDIETGGDERAA